LKIPGHHLPFYYFWQGIQSLAAFGPANHPVFFKGALSYQTHWDYYPSALVLKSTLPFLLLLMVGIGLFLSRRLRIPTVYWAPPLFFFLFSLPYHQIGLREILPIYPFLILIAAAAGKWLWDRGSQGLGRLGMGILTGLMIWHVTTTLLHYPAHISYFNELVKPDRKSYWLGDSNLDIGQDVKRLAATARERGWKKVKLAYFGPTDPKLYGMDWAGWNQKDLSGPQPGQVYAINEAFLQLGPAFIPGAPEILRSWITRTPPTGKVGDTWSYFETAGNSQGQKPPPPVLYTMPFVEEENFF